MTTTDNPSTAIPLELLTGNCGWSVVDPTTVLTRLWYFDGKFLRAEGFRRDQEYMRSLVALSSIANGHGAVHGLTASKGPGDTIQVDAGFAVAPSGRPVLLTAGLDLPIATLIARATGGGVGQQSGTFTPEPSFALCPPDAAGDPPATGGPSPMWVLYAQPIEALCGEEERFGQLCEDACASESDRSVVVEGVCFFVEKLDLALPTSSAIALGARHLRSRYASAYYRWERSRVASLVSGAGLRSPIWCRGAEGVTGDAVALGVFDRAGGVTSFVDAWTARRELMETNPHRYWHWRLARRPLDVFLAQVLQFQCQLLHLGTDPGTPGEDCEDERGALAATNEILRSLAQQYESRPAALTAAAAAFELDPEGYTRVAALQRHVASVLARGGAASTGSLLLDGGVVELPSCGYLPVHPDRSVRDQVRRWMGPGVDLRFCAVRPDFIGEAFDEAQHMERISLTQGIDDPGNLEEVDVLVPGGVVTGEQAEVSSAFQGILRIRPQIRVDASREATTGAALALSMVAKEQVGASWSWTLAGVGESAANVGLAGLVGGFLVDSGVDADRVAAAGVDTAAGVEVPFVADARHDARIADPSFLLRVNRERAFAQARRARVSSATVAEGVTLDEVAVGPDRKLLPGEDRPLALWIDLDVTQPLTSLGTGQSAPASLRLTLYSRAKEQAVLVDLRVDGSITVGQVVTGSAGGTVTSATTIDTFMSGHIDPLIIIGTHTVDQPARPFTDLKLTWQVGRSATGAKLLLVGVGPGLAQGARAQPTIAAKDEGAPRRVEATAGIALASGSVLTTHAAVLGPGAGEATSYDIARLQLDELADGLGETSPARAIAESAIDVIAAELSLPGRDPSFAATARTRLLAPDAASPSTQVVTGRADWVFFHRRRTKRCEAGVDAPVGVRRYRLHHAVIREPADLTRFAALGGIHARTADELPGLESEDLTARIRERSDLDYVHANLPVSGLGFAPVAVLEFEAQTARMLTPVSELRAAWQGAERGTRLRLAAAGDIGVGDGEDVVLGRLSAVRSAIADLVDQTSTRVRHLLTIPPEFQGSGLDGAMFTVGLVQPEVVTAGCVTMLRLDRETFTRIGAAIGDELDTTTLDRILQLLAELGRPVDRFDATFDEATALLNEAAVRHWWGPVPPVIGIALVGRARADAGERDLYTERSGVAATAIGLPRLAEQEVIADTGDCGAVLLLMGTTVGAPTFGRFGG